MTRMKHRLAKKYMVFRTPQFSSTASLHPSEHANTLFFVILGVQLCFRRFPIDGFSGKWWSK